MERWKRLVYYLMINVLVSACTTLVVLLVWERSQNPPSLAEMSTEVPAPIQETVAGTGGLPVSAVLTTTLQVPTPTLIPVPLGDVEEYEVQYGDTLGLVAEKFDVSIEDIMRVNQIPNPDSLSVGMLLYIPVDPGLVPLPTARPTNTPAPTVAITPSGPPQEARVIINSVISPGDLVSEQVFLSRQGDGDLSLAGWQLKDADGNVFVFPQLSLYQGGAVIIWTKTGSDTAIDLYWGLSSPVWSSGDKVTLLDASGKVHTTFQVP